VILIYVNDRAAETGTRRRLHIRAKD